MNIFKSEKSKIHSLITKKQETLRKIDKEIKDFLKMKPEDISDLLVRKLREEIIAKDVLIANLENEINKLSIQGLAD